MKPLLLALALGLGLAGCALPVPDKPQRPALYDLGLAPSVSPPAAGTAEVATAARAREAIALAPFSVTDTLAGTAMIYRLDYQDPQQPRPYALSRWTEPPARLLEQRLRTALAAERPVVPPATGLARTELRVELLRFEQVFSSPEASTGHVQLRLSLIDTAAARGERLIEQRSFDLSRPATSADAAGGVRALTAATDAAIADILPWLRARATPPPR